MSATQTLIDLNREYLRQGQRLILAVSDEVYTSTDQRLYTSCIGDHMRHVIEHYQRFLIGSQEGRVDYDARQRDSRISSDSNFAGSVIEQVIDGLNELPAEDTVLTIRMAVSSDGQRDVPQTQSSLNRELQYLQAHTIHHYALIALILKTEGMDPPRDFGFAPSTLQHVNGQ
jgi:uncharacterized damage-inducible protein DinB